MRILVYADEGVSPFALQETLNTFRKLYAHVETVNHHYLTEEEWEAETALLIMPGGRDVPYDRKLKGKGTAKIRKFVEGGGSFLGICAGAYFGAAEVVFEKESPIEVHEKRELRFFPGAAVGTLYHHSPFAYESEEGSHASHIIYKGEELHLYYNGGCTFKDAESYPGISVLARYRDAADQAAIIHCKVGKGNVILSGVHFEVSPNLLKKEGCTKALVRQLKDSDEKREKLITSLITYLNP